VFWQSADGTGVVERLTTSRDLQSPLAFTPDGKTLLMRDNGPSTGADLAIMSLEGDRTLKPLIHTAFNETNADLSPDGRWIAYQSNESGRDEIHVRPFPAVDSGHWQISTDGGTRPEWARSGRELFYEASGRIMAVAVQTSGGFSAGNPSVVVQAGGERIAATTPGRYYDVSLDGRRFLVIRTAAPRGSTDTSRLNIVLNWSEELKRLAPSKR